MEKSPSDLQTEWARLVVESLVRAGVRDAVISPGSRSTPFACAALENETLCCDSVWDERSAAHFALGQARATGVPSLLICTSGSAAANYFPAIVEAYEAGVPLVALTADRPQELQGCGANQTTDQLHMFGHHVRYFANLGEPSAERDHLERARDMAIAAVREATGARPGPVHLNAPARKPLEPAPAVRGPFHDIVAAIAAAETPVQQRGVDPLRDSDVDMVHEALTRSERGLLLLGPSPTLRDGCALADPSHGLQSLVLRVAQKYGCVVAAESTSQLRHFEGARGRVLGAADHVWCSARGTGHVDADMVLQIGEAPVQPGWLAFRKRSAAVVHMVIHPWKHADPSRQASAVLHADPTDALQQILAAGGSKDTRPSHSNWPERCQATERKAWDCVDKVLERSPWGEALAVKTWARVLPNDCAVVLGNSLPIRHVDTWVRPSDKRLAFYSQRGVSGIDGVVSGAAGVASKRAGPTTLLVGDVSFVHDVNGLQMAARANAPFVILVLNNAGGKIFSQLPIGEAEPDVLDFFTTPHDVSLAHACGLYRVRHETVDTASDLETAFAEAIRMPTCSVIEAVVPPSSAAEQSLRLRAAIEVALGRD